MCGYEVKATNWLGTFCIATLSGYRSNKWTTQT